MDRASKSKTPGARTRRKPAVPELDRGLSISQLDTIVFLKRLGASKVHAYGWEIAFNESLQLYQANAEDQLRAHALVAQRESSLVEPATRPGGYTDDDLFYSSKP